MDASTASLFATKLVLGCATDAEIESLASHTRAEALKVARWCAKNGRIAQCDCDDVAQEAAIRAMGHVLSWRKSPKNNATSWNTYVNAITRHLVADYGRRAAREQKMLNALKEEMDNEHQ